MHTLLQLLNILGAVSLYIYGMKVMSDGVQRTSGNRLQSFLNKMTKNSTSGFLAGTVFTGALQSSSIVSLLTLSFINAGLLNLRKAFSIIVGANVGTTFKLWVIVVLGTAWNIEALALPLIAIALPFFFFRNQKAKEYAHLTIGVALIFIGFYFLKIFIPDFSGNPYFLDLIHNNAQTTTIFNLLFFVVIGIFVTFLMHSSSAFALFAAVLVTKGLPIELGAMMIIGANIGTTSTALIASTIGNKESKIVAWFHFFFNLLGGFIFFVFTPWILAFIENYISTDNEIILISYHTVFNVASALLILPFIDWIAQFMTKKYLNKENATHSLKLIDRPFGPTAQMYVYEANREVVKFAGITRQIINNLGRMITESDEAKLNEFKNRIFQLEKESDQLEKQILNYLNTIYNFEMTGEVAQNIHRLIEICHHLESVGDIAIKIATIQKKRRKNQSYITPKLRSLLVDMHDLLSSATTILVQNLNEPQGNADIREAKDMEKLIDKMYKLADETLVKSIENEKLSIKSALYYKELIQDYETIGDHLYQANKALGK